MSDRQVLPLSLRFLPTSQGGGSGAGRELGGQRGVSPPPRPAAGTRSPGPAAALPLLLLLTVPCPCSPTRWDYYPRYFSDEEINLEPSPLCPHRVREVPGLFHCGGDRGSWRSPEPSRPEKSGLPPAPAHAEKEGEREGAGAVEGAGADRVEGAASVRANYPAHSRCSISASPPFLAESRRGGRV